MAEVPGWVVWLGVAIGHRLLARELALLGYVVRVAGRDVVGEHWPGHPTILARLLRIA